MEPRRPCAGSRHHDACNMQSMGVCLERPLPQIDFGRAQNRRLPTLGRLHRSFKSIDFRSDKRADITKRYEPLQAVKRCLRPTNDLDTEAAFHPTIGFRADGDGARAGRPFTREIAAQEQTPGFASSKCVRVARASENLAGFADAEPELHIWVKRKIELARKDGLPNHKDAYLLSRLQIQPGIEPWRLVGRNAEEGG